MEGVRLVIHSLSQMRRAEIQRAKKGDPQYVAVYKCPRLHKKKLCGWQVTLALEAVAPTECPDCGCRAIHRVYVGPADEEAENEA